MSQSGTGQPLGTARIDITANTGPVVAGMAEAKKVVAEGTAAAEQASRSALGQTEEGIKSLRRNVVGTATTITALALAVDQVYTSIKRAADGSRLLVDELKGIKDAFASAGAGPTFDAARIIDDIAAKQRELVDAQIQSRNLMEEFASWAFDGADAIAKMAAIEKGRADATGRIEAARLQREAVARENSLNETQKALDRQAEARLGGEERIKAESARKVKELDNLRAGATKAELQRITLLQSQIIQNRNVDLMEYRAAEAAKTDAAKDAAAERERAAKESADRIARNEAEAADRAAKAMERAFRDAFTSISRQSHQMFDASRLEGTIETATGRILQAIRQTRRGD